MTLHSGFCSNCSHAPCVCPPWWQTQTGTSSTPPSMWLPQVPQQQVQQSQIGNIQIQTNDPWRENIERRLAELQLLLERIWEMLRAQEEETQAAVKAAEVAREARKSLEEIS